MDDKQKAPLSQGEKEAATINYAESKDTNLSRHFQELLVGISAVPLPSHKANILIPLVTKQLKERTNRVVATDDLLLFYNGRYWVEITQIELGLFLRSFALRIGCPENIVSPYWGVDALVKQFKVDFYDKAESTRCIVNFQNSTLDLITLKVREQRRSDFVRYCLPYDYDPDAKCEKWLQCLNEWLPDKSMQILAQEVAGSPIARVHTEKMGYLYGDGCNGKSAFLEALIRVYGKMNVTSFSLEAITDKSGLALSQMLGALANISTENSQRVPDTSILKAYISGEDLVARKLYNNPITTRDYAPTICCANSLPQTDDYSTGFFRRFLFVPFSQTIPKSKINPSLSDELEQEVSGIFNWVLEGCKRLRKNGKYSEAQLSIDMAEDFRRDSDAVYLYTEEKGYKPTNAYTEQKMLLSVLYEDFSLWCKRNGFGVPSIKTTATRLRRLEFMVQKSNGNLTYVWHQSTVNHIDDPY